MFGSCWIVHDGDSIPEDLELKKKTDVYINMKRLAKLVGAQGGVLGRYRTLGTRRAGPGGLHLGHFHSQLRTDQTIDMPM